MRLFGLVDRWLLGRFLRAYLTFTGAALLAFVVVDLFANLDSLSEAGLLVAAGRRYGSMVPEVWFTLGPFLALVAALWAILQLQRQNELVPLIAAGLSPLRLAWPLLLAGIVLAPLAWADRELLLPALAPLRREARRSTTGPGWQTPRPIVVVIPGESGERGIGVLAPRFFAPESSELRDVRFTRLDAGRSSELETILAARGRPAEGGWLLENGLRITCTRGPDGLTRDAVAAIPSQGWLLRSSIRPDDVEAAIDSPAFQSRKQIRDQLRRTPGMRHLEVRLHERWTYSLAGVALLLVSVPITLRGQGGWDSYLRFITCVLLGLAFFLASTISYELGSKGALPPLIAAWAPLVGFGLIGLSLLARDARRA